MRVSCRDGRAVASEAGALLFVGALVGAVAITVAPAGPASACSCATFTLDSELAEAAAAFVGVASQTHGDEPRSWTFDVVDVVAGEVGEQVEVWQEMRGECGPNFELGELTGVVVRRDGDRFVTDDCGGVWLPEELLAPGTLPAPTGTGPPAVVATGRFGAAMLAAYDAAGDLLGWGIGDPGEELLRPRICPGSTTLVGFTSAGALERWDLAAMRRLSSVPLPAIAGPGPFWTDGLGISCTSRDGDLALLLTATPYGFAGSNGVVWVHEAATSRYPIDDAWDFAVAPDLASGYLLTGLHGTVVETIVLADGGRRPFAQLPEGLGGRALAVDDDTGRIAVFASSDAGSDPLDPPGVDRLVVLGDRGNVLGVASLEAPGDGVPGAVRWLDGDRLLAFWSLRVARIDVVTTDGRAESSFYPDPHGAYGPAVHGDRLYIATEDGVVSSAFNGTDARSLDPGIARVVEVAAVPMGER
jgi:hypothetical protein